MYQVYLRYEANDLLTTVWLTTFNIEVILWNIIPFHHNLDKYDIDFIIADDCISLTALFFLVSDNKATRRTILLKHWSNWIVTKNAKAGGAFSSFQGW